MITTFQLRGILEIYKPLADKLNYFNENNENKLKEIINFLEGFEEIFEDLDENFGINTKIPNFMKINGKNLIKQLIKNKIEVEIIKVSVEENKKYIVGKIEEIDDWIKNKMKN